MSNEIKTQSPVTLPKAVASAIETLRKIGLSNLDIIGGMMKPDASENPYLFELRTYSYTYPNTLMSALVNGYQVEKTPEEKVREYYDEIHAKWEDAEDGWPEGYCEGTHDAILTTLSILGITIEGVNA